jgi:hypothetical protein
MSPKPGPRTIWPANHPAASPTSSMTRRLWPGMYMFAISRFDGDPHDARYSPVRLPAEVRSIRTAAATLASTGALQVRALSF